jgi:hypothetical protein
MVYKTYEEYIDDITEDICRSHERILEKCLPANIPTKYALLIW